MIKANERRIKIIVELSNHETFPEKKTRKPKPIDNKPEFSSMSEINIEALINLNRKNVKDITINANAIEKNWIVEASDIILLN